MTEQPAMPLADAPLLVLLVDDQALLAESVRRALAAEPDIALHACTDPRDALDTARRLRPAVILQDLVMPGVDGLDLVRRYRADPLLRDVPIVVLSAREEPRTKSEAFARGANDYLVKLPDALELAARLRYHARVYRLACQRDDAFRALRESQRHLLARNTELAALNEQLRRALAQVKQLHGLLPICCVCKKIRNDHDYWQQLESYLSDHTDAQFSHGLCPDCLERELGRLKADAPPPADG